MAPPNMIHEPPLADRMRPRNMDEFVGQSSIIGKETLLRRLIENHELSSLILWGPPGVGKTTLAHIIAQESHASFEQISAVESGKADLRRITENAKKRLANKEQTVLFIDEIHRWNKAQQDALLPFVEKGIIVLIGATTENPSFEIIGALLSRSHVCILTRLNTQDIIEIVTRALGDPERGFGKLDIHVDKQTIDVLAYLSNGDARVALNGLDIAVRSKGKTLEITLTKEDMKEALQKTHVVFDKKGEEFYTIISALHKSMRGSDANAALYWLARMLEGGADPLYVARRIVRFASEDIGMANSEALIQAQAAYDACHEIGMPECSVHLAQAVVYCAKSQKSNLLYRAYEEAAIDARRTSHLPVPLHLRNAPTQFMKDIGYGKGYVYNPDFDEPVNQIYLPKELTGRDFLKKNQRPWKDYIRARKEKRV